MAVLGSYQLPSVNTLNNSKNPFVDIPYIYFLLVILYFVVYRVMVPSLKMVLIDTNIPYSFFRYLLILIFDFLLFAPILFFRRQLGFLHPLVFLMFLTLAIYVIEYPDHLLSVLELKPFINNITVSGPLSNYNQADLSLLEIKFLLLNILAQISLYIGFFISIKWKTFSFPDWQPKRLNAIVIFIVLCSLAGLIYYLNSKGGLTAHFSSFGLGRETAIGQDGIIHVLINFGLLATLVWFTFDNNAYLNPFFWCALVITIPSQFILSGSRSSLIFSALLFFLIYILKTKSIPTFRILMLGFLSIISIGILGAFRKSSFGLKEVNWEILTDFSVESSLDLYVDDVAHREAQQPSLTALEKGIQVEGLLWGKTYLGGILFFIPRKIWPDKPHSIGYYTGTLLYGSVGGKPPGDVIEAYWNFHIVGVVLVFFLYGTFLKWLARMLILNREKTAFFIIYIILLFYLKPSNLGLIKGFQQLIPVLIILWLIQSIPPILRVKINN